MVVLLSRGPDFWWFEVGGVWHMGNLEPKCELCGVMRAVVYCKQDMAPLCLQCDDFVHSANSISQRHLRSLLCDKCNSQPATIQCIENQASVCESCNCDDDDDPCFLSFQHHHRQLRFYSGNPSLEEFKQIWTYFLHSPGSLSANCINNNWKSRDDTRSLISSIASWTNRMKELITSTDMFSSIPQPVKDLSESQNRPICNVHDPCKESMDLEKTDEVYSSPQCYPNPFQEDIGMSSPYIDQSSWFVESNIEAVNDQEPINSCRSKSANINFPNGQVQSNASLSLSNINEASCVADYQDRKSLPVILAGNPTYASLGISCSQARAEAKRRYNDKKKNRKYGKQQIRYPSRKNRADNRQREKGRFVKAGETYGYNTISSNSFPLNCLSKASNYHNIPSQTDAEAKMQTHSFKYENMLKD